MTSHKTTQRTVPDAMRNHPPPPDKPPHPLVIDRRTKLVRYATREDIRRWERMEMRHENLLAAIKAVIGDHHAH